MPASKRAPAVAMQAFSPVDEAALQQIRKTAAPSRVSVLDVIKVITRLSTNNCSVIWNRLHERHPEVITSMHKFPGARQKHTHVADAKSICEIVMLLPGKAAADFRKRTAEVLVRYLGGDEALVAEIAANRLAQEGLPESHPMRVFGEAVDAGGVTSAASACEMVGRMLPSLLEQFSQKLTEKLTVHIHERFAAFEKQHRARDGPYALPDADPRTLSVAQFVKEKGCSSKNFIAAFGTLVAVRGGSTPTPRANPRGTGRGVVVYTFCSPGLQAARDGDEGAEPGGPGETHALHRGGPPYYGALLAGVGAVP